MSYVISIKRPISQAELPKAIEGDQQFSIASEGENHIDLVWTSGDEHTVLENGTTDSVLKVTNWQRRQRL